MKSLSPPKHSGRIIVEFPTEHVFLLRFNRPEALNAIDPELTDELNRVLNWFEDEPTLWVLIVTGNDRIFSAGADLKAWTARQFGGKRNETPSGLKNGFGALSRRETIKPIIAAVNGGAYGGGVEMLLNCDLVVAAEDAKFALPEVKRGVVANQGGIPLLAKTAGHQLASEMLLLGKTISAKDAYSRFGFVNVLVPAPQVVDTAISLAKEIISNSPDAVQSTKKAILLSQSYNHKETFTRHQESKEGKRVYSGENIQEGLKAFSEKRKPQWKSPAKL